MTDLGRRSITGTIYGAVTLVAVVAPIEIFVLVLAVVAGLALAELRRLRPAGVPAALELAVLGVGMASLVFLKGVNPPPCGARGCGLFGPLFMTIVAVWAADVAAYAVGSSIGRRKIVPRISPGKTWEGTIAGFLAAAAVVVLWNRPMLGLPTWSVAAAVLVGPAAFSGDLLESWVKRRVGVKDSGTMLPGHGGVLDRIDSLVGGATLVAATIVLFAVG